MKRVIALSLALAFSSPAVANVCQIAPSWDLGEGPGINIHTDPNINAPVIGTLPPWVGVEIQDVAHPWGYIGAWVPCCGYVEGWVWIRSVPAYCLPRPLYTDCGGCNVVHPPVAQPHRRYVEPHEKGHYQEPPHAEHHEEPPLEVAPMPENRNCYQSDAGCAK